MPNAAKVTDPDKSLDETPMYIKLGHWLLVRTRSSLEYIPLLAMFCVYVTVYTLFLLIRYNSFQCDYYDLGLWSRALYSASTNFSKIPALVLPTKASMIGHTDPFLLFFVPPSAIAPDPQWLSVASTVGLGASIFPLYLLARQRLASRLLAWTFCAVYLLNPLVNDINRYDFQPIAFAPLFILFALYFYEKSNAVGFFTSIVLANSTQEFVALLTAFLSLSLIAVRVVDDKLGRLNRDPRRELRARTLIFAGLIGIAWFAFAYFIQSYFDPSTPLVSFLSVASSGSPDPNGKILYLLLMVAPLLFVPLLEPILLAPVAPYVGVVVIGSHLAYWTIYYQYGAFTVPFIFYAALVAIQRIPLQIPHSFRLPSLRILLALLMVANLAFAINYSALSPRSPPGYTWSYVSSHDQALASMINLIPTGATVLTQGQIYPHIINRADISLYVGPTLYNRVTDTAPEYLMYDSTLSSFYYPPTIYGVPKNSSIPPSELLPEMVAGGQYGLYSAFDGAYLFQKNYQGPLVSSTNEVSRPLVIDGTWFDNVNYVLMPFGMSMIGGQQLGMIRDTSLAINESSFSLSFRLSESGQYLSKSWAALILGWKDPMDYSLINFNYLGGSMNLTSFTNGIQKTTQIGSTSPLSSVYQYFYVVAHNGDLQVYVDTQLVGTVTSDTSLFFGGIAFENWLETTNIQFLQFSSLQ